MQYLNEEKTKPKHEQHPYGIGRDKWTGWGYEKTGSATVRDAAQKARDFARQLDTCCSGVEVEDTRAPHIQEYRGRSSEPQSTYFQDRLKNEAQQQQHGQRR